MKFTMFQYELGPKKLSVTEMAFWGGLVFQLLLLLAPISAEKYLNIKTNGDSILFLYFIGLIPLVFSYIYQYYEYENINTQKRGHIEFDETGITLDYNLQIPYLSISHFRIDWERYYGQKINKRPFGGPYPKYSLGVKNKLRFRSNDQEYEFHFKLEDETHLHQFQRFLLELVTTDKLYHLPPKNQIGLISDKFKHLSQFKYFVIKLIEENRIDCTTGLLLHGYKTDKEAELLRKKHCQGK
ncbi:hypothetical protein [Sediminicola luteus]|nr:hypothetical protein [Sediminicola luteus]